MVAIVISAYNPAGKQFKKSVNSDHFTKKEIDEITLNFKRWIHSGQPPRDFKILLNPVPIREEIVIETRPKRDF